MEGSCQWRVAAATAPKTRKVIPWIRQDTSRWHLFHTTIPNSPRACCTIWWFQDRSPSVRSKDLGRGKIQKCESYKTFRALAMCANRCKNSINLNGYLSHVFCWHTLENYILYHDTEHMEKIPRTRDLETELPSFATHQSSTLSRCRL